MCVTVIRARTAFKTIVQWKQLNFEFPDECEREIAIKEGRFIPENCVPYDVDLQYKGQLKLTGFVEMLEKVFNVFYPFFKFLVGGKHRIFVTIPRFLHGIPITVGTVSQRKENSEYLIAPYPDYTWHSSYGSDCNGITSVVRMIVSISRAQRKRSHFINKILIFRSMTVNVCGFWIQDELDQIGNVIRKF